MFVSAASGNWSKPLKNLHIVFILSLKNLVNKVLIDVCATANRKLYYIHKLSSLDYRSVRNKEVKFNICICSLGPRFSVPCPY